MAKLNDGPGRILSATHSPSSLPGRLHRRLLMALVRVKRRVRPVGLPSRESRKQRQSVRPTNRSARLDSRLLPAVGRRCRMMPLWAAIHRQLLKVPRPVVEPLNVIPSQGNFHYTKLAGAAPVAVVVGNYAILEVCATSKTDCSCS